MVGHLLVTECCLFYRKFQAKSLVHMVIPAEVARAKRKKCITIMFGSSAMGEKLKMTAISRVAQPYSFNGKKAVCLMNESLLVE